MKFRTEIHIISREIFQVSLVTHMLLAVVEAIRPGLVRNFFALDYLLAGALLAGIIMAGTEFNSVKNLKKKNTSG